jgi:hypothetical protein
MDMLKAKRVKQFKFHSMTINIIQSSKLYENVDTENSLQDTSSFTAP